MEEWDVYDADAREYYDNEEKYMEMGLTFEMKQELEQKLSKWIGETEQYWNPKYAESEKDWDFFDGDDKKQWTQEAQARRKGRPILTLNQLPKFVKAVVGESKRNPPGIKLAPRSAEDRLKADIGMGVVRYVEDCSNAKYAYNIALESAAVGGFGWFRHVVDENGKIKIKSIRDFTSWYVDCESEEIDASDARFIFEVKKERTKNAKQTTKKVQIYWKQDGEVFWANLKNEKIVEFGQWYTDIIPVFPVFGEDIIYGQNRTVKGIVRNLRDPQTVYNYIKSQEVETIALTVKNGVMAEEGTLDGYEEDYVRAAQTPVPILYYKRTNLQGQEAAPPSFQTGTPNTQWAPELTVGASNDMKDISGIYDTSLGAESKELSGKAIIAKQSASDNNQYTYTEHLQASIRRSGESLLKLIPEVMGEETMITILGEDGRQSVVNLQQPMVDPATGQPVMIDLSEFTEYDVSVSSAPAFATRREAGADALQEIMKALPDVAPIIADLAVRNLDVPGAEEAAERLFMNLPENIRNPQPPQQPGMVPQATADQIMQQSQATIDQQKQIMDALQSKVFQLEQMVKKNAEIEMMKANMKNQTDVFIAEQRNQKDIYIATLKEQGLSDRQMKDIMADFEKQQREAYSNFQQEQEETQREIMRQQGETIRASMQPANAPQSVTIANTKNNTLVKGEQPKPIDFTYSGENFPGVK